MSFLNKNKSTKKTEINKPIRATKGAGRGKAEHKPYMDKRSFFSFSGYNETLGIILAVAVSFLGTYLFLPTHGIISALPLVVVSAFACVFFNVSKLLKVILFFISPFSVSILLGEKVFNSTVLGLICLLIYLLATVSVAFYKKGGTKNRAISFVLLLLTFVVHVFANSTPWDAAKNNQSLINYVESHYSTEPIFVSDVKFNVFDRTYTMTLIPQNNADYTLDVTMKDCNVISDQYVAYAEKVNMIIGAGQITYVIRELNPNLRFYVESDKINGYPFSESASIFTKNDYSNYMDYSVYFNTYIGSKEFSDLAEKCYRELILSGFNCRSITFYGGVGTKYVSKITVPFNSLTEDLKAFVKPSFERGFIYTCLK